MHTASKVFTVLNLLLALAFLLLTAPIVQDRQAMRAKISAQDAKLTPATGPGLAEQVAQSDTQRVKVLGEITLVVAQTQREVANGLAEKSRRVAAKKQLEDLGKQKKLSMDKWSQTLQTAQEEIASRKKEAGDLEEKVAQAEKRKADLAQEVAALKAKLDATKTRFADTLKAIEENYQKLLELEDRIAPPGRRDTVPGAIGR